MVNKVSLVSLACLLFSGCSTTPLTPQEQKYQQVKEAARVCSEEVKEHTIDLTAEGQSTNSRWTTVDYDMGDGLPPRTVEYRTSSVLDNGTPGNAWTACMKHKDALVPELKV